MTGRILGVDPGQSGGLAVLDTDGNMLLGSTMPLRSVGNKVAFNARQFYHYYWPQARPVNAAIIENVSAMPGQGVTSMFQFGKMFGAVDAVSWLVAGEVHYVAPRVWKGYFGLSKNKKDSIALAEHIFGAEAKKKFFPLVKHDGVAEAALIAYWWLRKNKDILDW